MKIRSILPTAALVALCATMAIFGQAPIPTQIPGNPGGNVFSLDPTNVQQLAALNSSTICGYSFASHQTYGVGFTGASDALGNLNFCTNSVIATAITPSATSFRLPSAWLFGWASTTNNTTAFDTGLSRPAAGTVSVDTTTVGNTAGTLKANGVFVTGQPATTGQRFACLTTTGQIVSSASACSGT